MPKSCADYSSVYLLLIRRTIIKKSTPPWQVKMHTTSTRSVSPLARGSSCQRAPLDRCSLAGPRARSQATRREPTEPDRWSSIPPRDFEPPSTHPPSVLIPVLIRRPQGVPPVPPRRPPGPSCPTVTTRFTRDERLLPPHPLPDQETPAPVEPGDFAKFEGDSRRC